MSSDTKHGLVTKRTLTPGEIAEIEQLINICNAHDGLRMRIGLDMLRERRGDETNDFLYYADGQLVGYLEADSYGRKDKELVGMVHPDYRRQSIFTALVTAAKEELQRRDVQKLIFVCEHKSESGHAFLTTTGADYAYAEHEMWLGTFHERERRSEGLSMRRADAGDINTIVSLLATDSGNVDEVRAWVTELMGKPAEYWLFLATLNGQPLGTVRLDFMEEVIGIYAFEVRLGYRGLGYGREILEQIIHTARAASSKPVMLDVETNNTNAIGLYLSCGFEVKTTYDYYELNLESVV
ncbi:MAG TPA: GNAT family N-acetyltransferase [Ktedonobacteraceae bacterium]|nr:GNAT family N-acetyltransferase [Ktedonobacteraceae bacterium]